MSIYHKSVFLTEALELLQIKKNKKYIDATLGGGGHTFEILRKNGIVLGIDLDTEAIEHVKVKWKKIVKEEKLSEENLILKKGNFRKLEEIARLNEFEKVAGIIYDLGFLQIKLIEENAGLVI